MPMLAELKNQIKNESQLVSHTIDYSHTPMLVSGIRLKLIRLRIKLTFLKVAIKCYSNPLDWIKAIIYLVKLRRRFLGNTKVQKMACFNDKYYLGIYTPGWNSKKYEQFIASQLNDYKPVKHFKANRFNNVFVAITKKCALQCEHCFEWENLNKKETLSEYELIKIIKRIQERGVSQIQLSGGEPLLVMNTMVNILNQADTSTDFWVVTSGFKLTDKNAKRLKAAGLKGVVVSLDHFDPEKHNTFRHFKDAYYWVEEAVKNANNNNLMTALSLCATNEFISENHLFKYMELAKQMKVHFVQLLEPKAVGHYANKNIHLEVNKIQLLENFFLKMNFDTAYSKYPIITYHGYYQRRQGCFSAGVKGIYIDTDGDMNACPFCHKKTGNVLDSYFDSNLELIKSQGCHTYKSV